MDDYIFQFQFMQEIKGSPVEEYLNSRRITQLPKTGLRYEPTAYESETRSRMPAMCGAEKLVPMVKTIWLLPYVVKIPL